jgi:hypothetical protein
LPEEANSRRQKEGVSNAKDRHQPAIAAGLLNSGAIRLGPVALVSSEMSAHLALMIVYRAEADTWPQKTG